MFDFRPVTLFSLGYRLSKHKMTIFAKNLEGSMTPWDPPGYAYELRQFCHCSWGSCGIAAEASCLF